MNHICVIHEYIPKNDPYGRKYISIKYTHCKLTLKNIKDIYNIENYDDIGSLDCWPIKSIIDYLKPDKFRLPKNLRYFRLCSPSDDTGSKQYIKQIIFPDKLMELELENHVINHDIDCEIDKLTIGTQCSEIIAFPKKIKKIVYESTYLHIKKIKSLPNQLPQNLVHLDISRTLITDLPELPDTLEYLLCDSNELTELPKLPPNLKELICHNNKLTKLPELPKSIVYLNCALNNIDELPLSLLDCKMNGWLHYCEMYINRYMRHHCKPRHIPECKCNETEGPVRYTPYAPANKNDHKKMYPPYFGFIFSNNPIAKEIEKYPGKNRNNRKLKKYLHYKKAVLKIEPWFLECKYNPIYKYCQKRLQNEFDGLFKEN